MGPLLPQKAFIHSIPSLLRSLQVLLLLHYPKRQPENRSPGRLDRAADPGPVPAIHGGAGVGRGDGEKQGPRGVGGADARAYRRNSGPDIAVSGIEEPPFENCELNVLRSPSFLSQTLDISIMKAGVKGVWII